MTESDTARHSARRILDELRDLSRISSMGEKGIARQYLTPEHRRANDWMRAKFLEAGLAVREDAVGNLFGRLEGTDPDAPAIMIGSHLDTVVDAGAFDGCLGVMTALEVARTLVRSGTKLRHPVVVTAFAGEEGVRFGLTYLGSIAATTGWTAEMLARRDANGISLAEALTEFGLSPERTDEAKLVPGSVAAYIELHIEQGPRLNAIDAPLARVESICAIRRYIVELTGEAGHTGTVPIPARHDAGCAAAELTLTLEREALRIGQNVVATAGEVRLHPNVVNCIPGRAFMRVDLRAPTDALLDELDRAVFSAFLPQAERRGIAVTKDCYFEVPSVPCDPRVSAVIDEAVGSVTGRFVSMPSGAGHDAGAMAAIAPVGMIFVRCERGISHSPLENVPEEDVTAGYEALLEALVLADQRF